MVANVPPTEPIQGYLAMIERTDDLAWLGHFVSLAEARSAITDWLNRAERDEEDAAFVLPMIAWGRARQKTDTDRAAE